MDHRDIRRRLAERMCALIESHAKLPRPFRPYQVEACVSAREWLLDLSGSHRSYVHWATGLGKTEMFAAIAAFGSGLRKLIIVPSKVLVEQTVRKTAEITGGILGYLASLPDIRDERGRVVGVSGLSHSDIVVTTDESLSRLSGRILEKFQPHVIVFDECHWAFAGPAAFALKKFTEAVIIGFSATPDYLSTGWQQGFEPVRLDNGQIMYAAPGRLASAAFQTLLDRRTLPWGIQEGWLSPLAWSMIDFDFSLKGLPLLETWDGGLDYQPSVLAKFLEEHWSDMTKAVCRLYLDGTYDISKLKVFGACPTVATAKELARAVTGIGVKAASITHDTPPRERRALLSAFAARELGLLTSVGVLREGWDSVAEVLLALRPTKSGVVYGQTSGRIVRPEEGRTKVALICDGVYKDTPYQPLTAPAVFSPIGTEVRPGDLLLNVRKGAPGPAHRAAASPYLLDDAASPVIMVEPIRVTLTEGSGLIVAEGDVWGTDNGLARALTVYARDINFWADQAMAKRRKSPLRGGGVGIFYKLADVVRGAHMDPRETLVENGQLDVRTQKLRDVFLAANVIAAQNARAEVAPETVDPPPVRERPAADAPSVPCVTPAPKPDPPPAAAKAKAVPSLNRENPASEPAAVLRWRDGSPF